MLPETRDAGYLLDMMEQAQGVMRTVKGCKFEDYAADEDMRLGIAMRGCTGHKVLFL